MISFLEQGSFPASNLLYTVTSFSWGRNNDEYARRRGAKGHGFVGGSLSRVPGEEYRRHHHPAKSTNEKTDSPGHSCF